MVFQQAFCRSILVAGTACLAACSAVDRAIVSTENGASRIFAGGSTDATPPASLDIPSLNWQKLSPASSVQFAVISDPGATAETTRVALKVPAGDAIPPFWQEVPESYTVLSGTFVVEALDNKGLPQHVLQAPGASARVPARMIQRMSSTAAGDGMMLVTVYGAWKPNFMTDAPPEIQRAAN